MTKKIIFSLVLLISVISFAEPVVLSDELEPLYESITTLSNNVETLNTATNNLDTEVNDLIANTNKYILRSGDIMTGDLSVRTKLSVGPETTQAIGNNSFASGENTIAYGSRSHAEGIGATTLKDYVLSGSDLTYTTSTSHGLKERQVILCNNIYTVITNVPDSTTIQVMYSVGDVSNEGVSLVEGIAYFEEGHSEGKQTTSSSPMAHAEGNQTIAGAGSAHAEGIQTAALGGASHAEGGNTVASGNRAHAEGGTTVASGNYSHAAGVKGSATNNLSWVWNGVGGKSTSPIYYSHGDGTFNVNSTNGFAGFFVGEKPLSSLKWGNQEIYTYIASGDNVTVQVDVSTTNSAIQFFNIDADEPGIFELVLPQPASLEYNSLTLFIRQQIIEYEYYTVLSDNCYSLWFPVSQPWSTHDENAIWKTKWESPPGTTNWYFMGAEKYPL